MNNFGQRVIHKAIEFKLDKKAVNHDVGFVLEWVLESRVPNAQLMYFFK